MHSGQLKEDELRMANIKIKEKINERTAWVKCIKERDYLGDLDIDGRMILKLILRQTLNTDRW